MSKILSGKMPTKKYKDPGNHVVTVNIQYVPIENTLVGLGSTINIMTIVIYDYLRLTNLTSTPNVLELVDNNKVMPIGIIEYIMVTLDSWDYPIDFFLGRPKSSSGGHPLILGRPCLATTDALIRCRTGQMTISKRLSMNKLTLYP